MQESCLFPSLISPFLQWFPSLPEKALLPSDPTSGLTARGGGPPWLALYFAGFSSSWYNLFLLSHRLQVKSWKIWRSFVAEGLGEKQLAQVSGLEGDRKSRSHRILVQFLSVLWISFPQVLGKTTLEVEPVA